MQNPSWMDRISAMTANSKKSYLNTRSPRWKLSIADIQWADCSWEIAKRTILKHPLDDFIVWFRASRDLPWERVANIHINPSCSCGKPWTDVHGNVFAFRGKFREPQYYYEDMVEWLNSPLRCKYCFYRDQHAEGNWAPKSVLKELGLNPN